MAALDKPSAGTRFLTGFTRSMQKERFVPQRGFENGRQEEIAQKRREEKEKEALEKKNASAKESEDTSGEAAVERNSRYKSPEEHENEAAKKAEDARLAVEEFRKLSAKAARPMHKPQRVEGYKIYKTNDESNPGGWDYYDENEE